MTLLASDKKSALMGFVIGGIVIFLVLLGMVRWTNAKFESHAPAAEATH